MAIAAPSVPERRVSWWKRSLVALGLFIAVMLLSRWLAGEWIARSSRLMLAAALAETDQADPRWRWGDLEDDRPVVLNQDNSAHRVREAFAAMTRSGMDELTAVGDDLPGAGPANHRLDPERLAKLLQALQRQRPARELSLALKDLPRGRSDLRLTADFLSMTLPNAQECREVAGYLLRTDAERLLHEGQADEAADRVRAMLHIGAGLRDEPSLISQMVRIAIRSTTARQTERMLGLGEVSDETCRRLMEQLAAERAENPLLIGLRGARAGYHVLFENLESGRVPLADFLVELQHQSGHVTEALIRGGAVPRLYGDHASMLRWLNRACKIAALPPHEQTKEWEAYDKEYRSFRVETDSSLRNIVTVLLLPGIADGVADKSQRDHAMLACAQAALAAERFRLANKRWPATLDELRPNYLEKVPIDPYTGKPLLFVAMEDGLTIYTTGRDGKDDGGTLELTGNDLGVRLYNPDRRGLEPLKMPRAE